MKKALSLFLAIIMIFSCIGAIGVSAADEDENYTKQDVYSASEAMKYFKINGLPEGGFDCNIDGLKTLDGGKYWTGDEKINLIGIDLDFLYSHTDPLVWSTLDVYKKDADGNFVRDEAGNIIVNVSEGEIALTLSSINAYLKNLHYSTYGGLKLYNVKNAVGLANVIGGMFYRDFEKLNPDNFSKLFGNETPNAQEFFEAVVSLSKLDVLIQANWCTRGRSFCEPVVKALGGDFTDIYNDNYSNGKVLGARILEGMFAKMNIVGPVQVFYDAIKTFMTSYESVYREPILALFTHKMEKIGLVTSTEKFKTFSGLIDLIFCNCDPLAKEGCFATPVEDVDHFCPLEFPTMRLATANDEDEFFIYLFYYLNLCGKYRGNAAFIERLRRTITMSPDFNSTAKTRLKSILDGYFLNNIVSTSDNLVTPYLNESINEPSPNGFFDRLKNSLMVLLKKIADYFDYLRKLFSGDIDYGQGESPFI